MKELPTLFTLFVLVMSKLTFDIKCIGTPDLLIVCFVNKTATKLLLKLGDN